MSKIEILIQSLNGKLAPDIIKHLADSRIEDIIRAEIETVLGIDEAIRAADYQGVDTEKLKKTYHKLARALNTDHLNSNPYVEALKVKNMERLPHSTLNSVWDKITKKSTENTKNIPVTSFYPLEFAQKKIEFLGLLIKEYLSLPEERQQNPEVLKDLHEKFKNEFSELYYYENYPLWAQYVIYGFYSSINTAILATILAQQAIVATLYNSLNRFITYPLLDFGIQSRYFQFDAKILTMKATLEANNIPYSHLQDDEIIEAFENIQLITKDSQVSRLANLGFDNLSEALLPRYFKCCFVIEHVNMLDSNEALARYLDDVSNAVNNFHASFNTVKNQKLSQQIESLINLDSIETLYTKIRDFQNNQLESACKQNFGKINARQQIASIGNAIYAMATDKTQPILNRIFRGFVLAISAPIILASCFIQLLFEITFQILMAIKLLSAKLVNAPLKAYSYFNTTSTSAEKTNSAGVLTAITFPAPSLL